jgi:hypothetical protein
MKKTILILAFAVIASCASSQTLLSPSQMGVSTNDYSLISTNTNMRAVLKDLVARSKLFQSGSCTNGQTVVFSNAYASVPSVSGIWNGTPVTNAAGHWPTLYFSVLTITNFIMESTVAQTNTLQIRWQAQP